MTVFAGALPRVLSHRQSGGSDSVGCHPAHSLQPPPETLELVLLPPTQSDFPANQGLEWRGLALGPTARKWCSSNACTSPIPNPPPQPSCLPSQVRRPDPGSQNALHISTHSTWCVASFRGLRTLMALLPAHCCALRLTQGRMPSNSQPP